MKEEKENEEAEMKKAKKKVRVWDLNRSIAAEAQDWEKFISDQIGLSLSKVLLNVNLM